jgi:hypothetical protein
MDTECEGERGHGLLYRPGSSVNGISLPEMQKWRSAILDCNLRFGDNRYMEGEGTCGESFRAA